jgi:hypothetical protein
MTEVVLSEDLKRFYLEVYRQGELIVAPNVNTNQFYLLVRQSGILEHGKPVYTPPEEPLTKEERDQRVVEFAAQRGFNFTPQEVDWVFSNEGLFLETVLEDVDELSDLELELIAGGTGRVTCCQGLTHLGSSGNCCTSDPRCQCPSVPK